MTNLFSLKNILILSLLIVIDIIVYMVLGLALMNYEDFYQPSDGPFYSWQSMSTFDQKVFISLQIWNAINIAVGLFLAFKAFFYFRKNY